MVTLQWSVVSIVALSSLLIFSVPPASAQFGGFFGGSKIETIDTKEVIQLTNEQQRKVQKSKQNGQPSPAADFVLIDVRSDKEIAVSIIPGAITKTDFEKNQADYRDKLIIPYCTVGGRSEKYAKQLLQDGWRVKNYKGSILEWIGAEQPLVTVKGEPTQRVHTYSNRYLVPANYQQVAD